MFNMVEGDQTDVSLIIAKVSKQGKGAANTYLTCKSSSISSYITVKYSMQSASLVIPCLRRSCGPCNADGARIESEVHSLKVDMPPSLKSASRRAQDGSAHARRSWLLPSRVIAQHGLLILHPNIG